MTSPDEGTAPHLLICRSPTGIQPSMIAFHQQRTRMLLLGRVLQLGFKKNPVGTNLHTS